MHPLASRILIAAAALTAGGAAFAQTIDRQNRPPEVLVVVRDDAPRCEPQMLRVPSKANIDLRITNQGTRTVLVNAPQLFTDDQVRAAQNAKKQGDGYLIEPKQDAQFIVLTPPDGEYRFACVEPGQANADVPGSLVTVRSATQYNK